MAEIFEELERPESEAFAAEADAPAVEVVETAPVPEPTKTEPAAAAPASAATEVPAAPSAAPAPAAEAPKAERTVPLTVLLEERRERDSRIKELHERLAKLETPAKPAEPDPDYLDDPKGYTDAQIAKTKKELAELKAEGTREIREAREEVGQVRLANAIASAEEQIRGAHPDYMDAIVHVRNARFQQLSMANPEATQEQVIQHIRTEELQLAAHNLSKGKNPYEYVYQFAKTIGYAPAPPPAPNGADVVTAAVKAAAPPLKTLSPETTIGKSAGTAPVADADGAEGEVDVLEEAIAERFGRKRA